MKKYLIATLVLIFAAGIAYAETPSKWHPTNQVTIAWDLVENEAGTVQYVVYRQQVAHGSGAPIGEAIPILTTATPQAVVTFDLQGTFILGVKSQLVHADGEILAESTTSWSNDAAMCLDGVTFGVRYYVVGHAFKLRLVQ
jgi:hypothetical protein